MILSLLIRYVNTYTAYVGYEDRKRQKYIRQVWFSICHIPGNAQPLTVGLHLVGGDLDEIDGAFVVVVVGSGGRMGAAAHLLQ